jgi:hypothetical protein
LEAEVLLTVVEEVRPVEEELKLAAEELWKEAVGVLEEQRARMAYVGQEVVEVFYRWGEEVLS